MSEYTIRGNITVICAFIAFGLSGCINPPTRMGMVKDSETGLQFGSVIERNLVTDSSFYSNKRIKVRTRNTSGDTAFNLSDFGNRIRAAYAAKGYQPTDGDDFGLLVDVNVVYSGQVQSNLANKYTFLGAAAGGLAGAAKTDGGAIGTTAGVFAGATLGNIIGSYVTDDTYIIVTRVTFGEIKQKKRARKSISFSRSPKTRYDEEDRDNADQKRGFKKSVSLGVSVFAGGRNVPQSMITGEVRERIVRIVGDII